MQATKVYESKEAYEASEEYLTAGICELYESAETYVKNLGESLIKMDLKVFFEDVNSKFFKVEDLDFMGYFLSIVKVSGFKICHDKLFDCGIMKCTDSNDVSRKLYNLGLEEGKDYIVIEAKKKNETSRGFKICKYYYMTPDSFKICLMRAFSRSGQVTKPMTYCKYYLLLEKMYKLYTYYQEVYDTKLVYIKDSKISEQSDKIDNLMNEVKDQSAKIDKLLGYSEKTTKELVIVKEDNEKTHKKLDSVSTELVSVETKLVSVSTELVEVKNTVVETKSMVRNIASNIKTGVNSIVNFFKAGIPECMRFTKAETTKKYVHEFVDTSSIYNMKLQYVVISVNRHGRHLIYPRCTNIKNIKASLKSVEGRIISVIAIAPQFGEINSEYNRLKNIHPKLTSRRKFEYDGDVNSIIDSMRESHSSTFTGDNQVAEYIRNQDSEFYQNILIHFQDLLQIYADNMNVSANRVKAMVDAKLATIVDCVNRDFNNDERIVEMIRENGEENILAQLEQLKDMSD